MKTVTTKELQERLEEGPLALFDVRGDVEYELEHIPGAKTAPLGSLTFRVARTMFPESLVVVYDRDVNQGLASEAVERLTNLGMTNVRLYPGGLDGWRSAGLSTMESPQAKVHTRGPVKNCRAVLVDREEAYGGAFRGEPVDDAGGG